MEQGFKFDGEGWLVNGNYKIIPKLLSELGKISKHNWDDVYVKEEIKPVKVKAYCYRPLVNPSNLWWNYKDDPTYARIRYPQGDFEVEIEE